MSVIEKSQFSEEVELLFSSNKDLNVIDAVIEICEKYSFEVDSVKALLSNPLIDKIECQARKYNNLKRTTNGSLGAFL